jgi:hypothetical protein
MAERWLDVVGYEEIYQVSDCGRVRSLDRVDCRGYRLKGKVLSPIKTKTGGYLTVDLCNGQRRITKKIHALVLRAFRGECPEGKESCHCDGNPANNCLENLRWDTHSANTFDKVRHGTHPQAQKTHCPQGHTYDEENTYKYPNGGRRCRECHRLRERQRLLKRKASG